MNLWYFNFWKKKQQPKTLLTSRFVKNRRNTPEFPMFHSKMAIFLLPATHEIVTRLLYQMNFYVVHSVINENVVVVCVEESLKYDFQ